MANDNILFVLLSFGLYLLFVLVPIIPAALLYKWFPDSQVSANGVLSKFKINSSGAFAAYLVTVLLGYFVIADIKETVLFLAKSSSAHVWVVRGDLQLQDKNGNEITETSLFETRLSFDFKPDFLIHKDGNVDLQIPGPGSGELPQLLITVNVDGFGQETLCLSKLTDDDAIIDRTSHLIHLKKPLIIKTLNDPDQLYTPNEYLNK